MTLKEQKNLIENSVAKAISSVLNQNVSVKASYDLEHGIINVDLDTEEENNNIETLVHYSIVYSEELSRIAITAFQRSIHKDGFGPAVIINNPITIDEEFMLTIKQTIINGAQAAYNATNESDKPAE